MILLDFVVAPAALRVDTTTVVVPFRTVDTQGLQALHAFANESDLTRVWLCDIITNDLLPGTNIHEIMTEQLTPGSCRFYLAQSGVEEVIGAIPTSVDPNNIAVGDHIELVQPMLTSDEVHC